MKGISSGKKWSGAVWWLVVCVAIVAAFDDDEPLVSRSEEEVPSAASLGCELSCSVLAPESESAKSLKFAVSTLFS
eukprot:CAMPEP_0179423236 /NCGR_PEP_ID=MMETSP0799-20121207/10889_1 /TAXON_ID=46947 /ORGANISM="Geminigera cryophila, Strain CCMP2564" /LENGTH=75 /DNA_ID=CAMNT_0021197491 /DNA_START=606 /DNA_END=833 /DNA_ORIENTATION=-